MTIYLPTYLPTLSDSSHRTLQHNLTSTSTTGSLSLSLVIHTYNGLQYRRCSNPEPIWYGQSGAFLLVHLFISERKKKNKELNSSHIDSCLSMVLYIILFVCLLEGGGGGVCYFDVAYFFVAEGIP